MYVCQCRGVTDRQIRGAVAEGCTTLRSVAAATGAATGCGGCIATIRDLVCGSCPSRVVDAACDDTAGLDRVELGSGAVDPAYDPSVHEVERTGAATAASVVRLTA